MKLTKLQQKVYNAILAYPEAANDDCELLRLVWQDSGWVEGDELYINLKRVPRAESITRCRRKLHEKGLIEYSDEADKQRYDAFVEFRTGSAEPVRLDML